MREERVPLSLICNVYYLTSVPSFLMVYLTYFIRVSGCPFGSLLSSLLTVACLFLVLPVRRVPFVDQPNLLGGRDHPEDPKDLQIEFGDIPRRLSAGL